ncbi:MAG TPA: Gfo/Idh/MocA family oxidoreductase [Candidatus Hydrogenedentes bacterium]|nr:Gfo/Idh/MocA family oxidoreductase [Candidatus Hydrogenedentota bacterium]
MAKKSDLTRRGFLRTSVAAGAAIGFPYIIPSSALGKDGHVAPSERVVVGCIGVGNRGNAVLGETLQCKQAQVVAVCDVKRDWREKTATTINDFYGNKDCAVYNNHEELVARTDIDAVNVASCDHWHVLHALAAVRAGKGVYVEKPLGITMEQDQVMRDEVKKRGVVFQFGTQQRSDRKFRHACELVRNGYIGKMHTLYVWAPASSSGGYTEQAPVPETLDYDRWLGPAPFVPYTKERDSNKWWWFNSDYALGFIAGWGIHPVDIAVWGAGDAMLTPCWIEGTGQFPTEGFCNTATDWKITVSYDSGIVVEYHAQPAPKDWLQRFQGDEGHGTAFVGDKGWVQVSRSGLTVSDKKWENEKIAKEGMHLYESKHHVQNFIECVREKKPPVSDIDEALKGDLFCHACDIAIRLKQRVRWDPVKETFADAPDALARMTQPMRAPWKLTEG